MPSIITLLLGIGVILFPFISSPPISHNLILDWSVDASTTIFPVLALGILTFSLLKHYITPFYI